MTTLKTEKEKWALSVGQFYNVEHKEYSFNNFTGLYLGGEKEKHKFLKANGVKESILQDSKDYSYYKSTRMSFIEGVLSEISNQKKSLFERNIDLERLEGIYAEMSKRTLSNAVKDLLQ